MSGAKSSVKKVYLDTNILGYWAIEPESGRSLTTRAENCKKLLDLYTDGTLNVILQTSEWALGEVIQAFIDKIIWQKFPFEGYELRELRRMKKEFSLRPEERAFLDEELDFFVKSLDAYEVERIPVKYDHKMIHDLVIRYGITTNDALHVVTASGVSDYIVTTDSEFIEAKISEIQVVDPGNLITIKGLRSR